MGNIVLLDDLTINKIAAGEVIERPLNVVKEVVENSIDAGATKIIVEIKKGGKQLIKVIDNGKGIPKDDMDIALERHATSKLRKIEDLEKIYTMGFRGEALASIVSVAKLTMISRTSNDDFGTKLVAEAGDILEREETGARLGTTIMVENLFFNVPVRYKFLKQDATEFKYIKDWIQKAALSIPSISDIPTTNTPLVYNLIPAILPIGITVVLGNTSTFISFKKIFSKILNFTVFFPLLSITLL